MKLFFIAIDIVCINMLIYDRFIWRFLMLNNDITPKDIEMITSEKLGYKIPSFLEEGLEFIPNNTDFYTSYADVAKDEIPFWWQRDINLALTKRERRQSRKRNTYNKNLLEKGRIRAERVNEKFRKIIAKQGKEFKKRCHILQEEMRLKLEELDKLEQKNKIEHQNKLLELELELQQVNAEKVFLEKEKAELNKLKRANQTIIKEDIAHKEAVAAIDESIKNKKSQNKVLHNNINVERAKKDLPLIELAQAPNDKITK